LLKITSPGVPDTYQGTEIWDFSLVDPDNSRPVDYTSRSHMLQQLQTDGHSLAIAEVLRHFPAALLVAGEKSGDAS
jgi:(1->4)-alpha-D-glucan 1-alpha-D-glucosylmutase